MRCLYFILAFSACTSLYAQELNIGATFRKTHTMYWENGISAQYSFANFKPGQFYLGFDYLSSRLGSAFLSNALKQDSYLVSAAWHFRKNKTLGIVAKLNTGYFHVSLEEEIFNELPNAAFLISPETGLFYDFKNLPLAVNLGAGFQMDMAEEGESPGTLQPLFYHLTLYYQLY